jgi:metallo-beta-lactamase class B
LLRPEQPCVLTVVRVLCCAAGLVLTPTVGHAQEQRARWNAPQAPFRIFGNAYYVGPHGVSSVLITSDAGHVLIDAALPESVPGIVASIRGLGFRIEDIKLILNSHVHFDHAGGIAGLRRLSGARVAATAPSARVLERGRSGPDDPQYGVIPDIARVKNVQVIADGETLRVGPLALTAHTTGGHTPGGTSWTWKSCQGERCLDMVYADSLTAVSAEGFAFTRSREYPGVLTDFEKSFSTLSAVACDVLITTHPEASDLWDRLARRDQGAEDALVDPAACRRYVDSARTGLRVRVDTEGRQQ